MQYSIKVAVCWSVSFEYFLRCKHQTLIVAGKIIVLLSIQSGETNISCCRCKNMLFSFLCVVPSGSRGTVKDMENMLPLMKMVIYCIDKTKRFRLTREVSLAKFTGLSL